ncbi:MAG TPA: hypothetical protein VGV40_11835 [Solirubrobacteraceae bacterium]|nr:hypothetical protein [Solirubrobacteraceae bacterium]
MLAAWNRTPWLVVRRWLAASVAVAAGLLTVVWLVAAASTPDASGLRFAGLTEPATGRDVGLVLVANSLVLALHAFACVAGYLARRSLPLEAARYRGVTRWVHEHAGPAAMAFVGAATLFSLATQAYELGLSASTLAAQLGISPGLLLLGLLPHALPELVALFLPLAAWLVAARAQLWHELLAATAVTVAIAVPVLLVTALVEVFITPHLLQALVG